MSSEIQFRQQLRKRKKKQKSKKNLFIVVLSLVIITVFALAVKTIFTKISEKKNSEPDFIFNGYVYPQPPEKSADILAGIPDNNGVKTAYLTFDDGPNNSVTPQVLDTLRRYNIKATFFMVGAMIEKNPDMARRVFEEGHLVAGHSYSHQYSELYADTQSFMNEVNKTYALIQDIVGKNNYPKIFRFPGGGFDTGVYGEIKQECKLLLEEGKYRYCDWNSLNGDAETNSPVPAELVKRLKSTSKNKEDIVVLMHDAPSKAATAEALPQIIEYLAGEGYAFDTLDNV